MATIFLLIVIYLAYLSLGLPDGLTGVAWPEMRITFNLPLAGAGFLTIIGTIGSTIASFSSGHILRRIKTGPLVLLSCLLTGVSIFLYGFAGNFWFLVMLTIPMGFGAGAVDAAMNHYVARHFTSKHMNWLHAFWGMGAFAGPLLMTFAITSLGSWRNGYHIVGIIQLVLAVIFFLSLRVWTIRDSHPPTQTVLSSTSGTNNESNNPAQPNAKKVISPHEIRAERDTITDPVPTINSKLGEKLRLAASEVFSRKGLFYAIATFFFYVGAEAVLGLWSATYFREVRHVTVKSAGLWVSLYYAMITVGRIFIGFFVEKIGATRAIKIGVAISILGFAVLITPIYPYIFCPIGIALIGFGFAPLYPCVMQDTPLRFGSFAIIATGYQMGFANIGYTLLPILVALVADAITLHIIPLFALAFLLLFAVFAQKLSRIRA